MNIIRWISCHLIIVIVVISVALAWSFRQELASDYARLTNKDAAQSPQPVADVVPSRPAISEAIPVKAPDGSTKSSNTVREQPGNGWSGSSEAPKQNPKADYPGRASIDAVENTPTFPDDRVLMQPPVVTVPPAASSKPDSMFPPDDYDPEYGKNTRSGSPMSVSNAEQAQPPFRATAAPAQKGVPQPDINHGYPDNDAVAQAPSDEFQAQLESARRNLWAGELDKARQEYEALFFAQPDNPEIASELGNLLMQQNRIEEAGRVYDSAIINFRRLKRDNEAIGLIRFISRYNPALADTLYNNNWQ